MSSIYNSNYSYDFYLRSIYSFNRLARKEETRAELDNKTLLLADSSAMKKISKQLRELEYDSDHGTEIYNSVKLYVETYNNLLESTSDSDSSSIQSLKKQITQLTKEEKDNLASIGISISSSGKLHIDESTFVKSEPSKIAKVFSSKNALTESIQSYTTKIRSKALRLPVYTNTAQKTSPAGTSSQAIDISL